MQRELNQIFRNKILSSTGADDFYEIEVIQSLWSGYGEIVRMGLVNSEIDQVVVKHVNFPNAIDHPRGWNTGISHQRKLKSYQVETNWYKSQANSCDERCRIPKCYAVESHGDEVLMVFEDLDASGYSVRHSPSIDWESINACLSWLAHFHAVNMGVNPNGLWETGTYWHLATRPDELEALSDLPLKKAAEKMDRRLTESPFQTIVHGDAKLANFCFHEKEAKVAAVDFQYVGGGCGMKDVAYFVGSCMGESDCERYEDQILKYYFSELKKAVELYEVDLDFKALEENWHGLYYTAWADFHRFVKGWHPGHWKINSYSERVSREVVDQLK